MASMLEQWLCIRPGVLKSRNCAATLADAADLPRADRTAHASEKIGPVSKMTEGEFRTFVAAAGMTSPERQDRLLLIVKVGLSLASYGEETGEAVKCMEIMADLFEIPGLKVHFTNLTTMHFSFHHGPAWILYCATGLNPGRVSATSCLGRGCVHKKLSDGSVSEALNIMDQIIGSECAYGKLWQLMAEWLSIGLCPIAVFGGTWRDAYAVMAINTVSMFFQRFNVRSEALEELKPMIVAFIAGAGASIDVLLIRDTERCHAVPIIMSVLFNYLPGSGIIHAAGEIKSGNVVLGTGRLAYVVLKVMSLTMGVTFGWVLRGYNSVTDVEFNHTMGSHQSLPPSSYCSKGAYEGWEMVYAGCGSIWIFVFLVYLHVDPRDMPFAFLATYGIWCLYGYLAETQPEMPFFMREAILLFCGMMVACFEEFRGGMSRVVMRACLTAAFAPSATAINMIISGLFSMLVTGTSSDLIGHLFFMGVAYAVGDGVAQAVWHPAMEWKRRHALKTGGFNFADRLADRFMVDQAGEARFKEVVQGGPEKICEEMQIIPV